MGSKTKTSFQSGGKHPKWKGGNVGYYALHMWLTREYGKPLACEECGSTRYIQWANKSQRYLRERSDWMHLCSSCHKKYDIKANNRNAWNKGMKVDRSLYPKMGNFRKPISI